MPRTLLLQSTGIVLAAETPQTLLDVRLSLRPHGPNQPRLFFKFLYEYWLPAGVSPLGAAQYNHNLLLCMTRPKGSLCCSRAQEEKVSSSVKKFTFCLVYRAVMFVILPFGDSGFKCRNVAVCWNNMQSRNCNI